jgi:hypothetical protein
MYWKYRNYKMYDITGDCDALILGRFKNRCELNALIK